MSRPTIEDVLASAAKRLPRLDWVSAESKGRDLFDALRTATANGPIVSADGTLIVHRADPELAADLNEWARRWNATFVDLGDGVDNVATAMRRAAALVAGDPKDGPRIHEHRHSPAALRDRLLLGESYSSDAGDES